MLLCSPPSTIHLVGTIASSIIAASAVFQFGYLIFIQAKKEKKRNQKEWFHRLIIEPKIDDIYNFLDKTEEEIENLRNITDSNFDIEEALEKTKQFKFFIYKFRKSFVHTIFGVDKELANNIRLELDKILDMYANNAFREDLSSEDITSLLNQFFESKKYIITYIYQWNN
jgi:hypothetical protein